MWKSEQLSNDTTDHIYTGYTQKDGAVSKVNKKYISQFTRVQRTPSTAATIQVSHALPAVRFSCLLRVQFLRWRRSRKKLSVCSVLRCPDLWLQCSVNFVHGLEKTHHAWCVFSKPCNVITDLDTSKRSTQKAFSCCDAILENGPAVSMRSELLIAHEKLGQLPLLTV